MLFSRVSGQQPTADRTLEIVDQICSYLDSADVENADFTWLDYAIGILSTQVAIDSRRGGYLRSAYLLIDEDKEKPDEDESKVEKELRERIELLTEKRNRLHDELARKMIDIPSVSSTGFTALLASHEAKRAEVGEEFVQYAMTALQPVKKTVGSRGSASMMQRRIVSSRGFYSGSNSKVARKRSPIQFLARYYGTSEADSDADVEKLVNQLTEWKAKEKVEELEMIYELYKASPEQFVSVAKQLIEKGNSRRSSFAGTKYARIVEIWADRQAPCDLTVVLIEETDSKPGRSGDGDRNSAVVSYISWLAENEKLTEAADFLTQYRTSLIGDLDEAVELLEASQNSNSGRGVSRGSRKTLEKVRNYERLIRQLMSEKATVLLAVKEAQRLNSEIAFNNFGYEFPRFFSEFGSQDVEQAIAWLGQIDVLKEFSEFDGIVIGQESAESKWAIALLRLNDYSDSEIREALVEHYKQQTDKTFGEKLLVMACNGDLRSAANVYGLLGESLEEFEALSQEKQFEMAKMVGHLVGSGFEFRPRSESVSLEGNAATAKRLVSNLLGSSASANVEKILDAKRLSDLGIDEYEFNDWANEVVKSMDKSDPEKVAQVFAKTIKLSNREDRFFSEYVSDSLIDMAISGAEFDSFKIVLLLMSNAEFKQITISETAEQTLIALLQKQLAKQHELQDENANGKNRLLAFDAVYQELGDKVGQQDISCLFPMMHKWLNESEAAELERLQELMALESKDGKYKQIATTWWIASAAALEVSRAREATEESDSEDTVKVRPRRTEMFAYEARLLPILQDESLTMPWRLTIVEHLAKNATLPAEVVWECVDLATKANKQGARVSDLLTGSLFAAMQDFEQDEKFASRVESFGKSWLAAYAKSRNGYSYGGSVQSRMIESAVRVFAKSDNRILVNQVLRNFAERTKNRSTIAVLVESGFHPEARKLLLEKLKGRSSNGQSRMVEEFGDDEGSYTRELEKATPAFVELFAEPGLKLLVEAWLADLADLDDKSKATDTKRADRLSALASRYPTTEFRSKSQQDMTLILLAGSPGSATHIAEPLEKLAGKLQATDLWDSDSGVLANNCQLLSAHIVTQIQLKNFQPLITVLKELSAVEEDENDWYFDSAKRELLGQIDEPLSELVSNSSPEELVELLPMLRSVYDPAHDVGLSQEVNLLAHLLAGKTDELVNQYAEFNKDKEEDGRRRVSLDPDSLWPKIVEHLEATNRLDQKDERLKVVKEVWQISCAIGLDCGSGHFQEGIQESCAGCRDGKFGLDAIKEAGLMSGQELAEHAAALAEMGSVDGEIWRQLGKEHLELEQLEQAAECFQKALAGSTEEMDQAKTNRKIEYAFVLDQLERGEECKKLLEDIDGSLLLGDNIKRYSKLSTKFKGK